MELTTVWFVLVAALFTGYFVLEGFDFGVGALLPVLGRDEPQRRMLLGTIGPVWDGNEVWVITAGGAMFAAFPAWYATLFSALYLPLLLILLALILRGVAFEYRGMRDHPTWRARWDAAIVFGSTAPAFLWGVAFANIARGLPLAPDGDYTGGLLDLLHPYALLGGVVTLSLFVTHGAVFLALKTEAPIRARAARAATRVGPLALAALAAFAVWTLTTRSAPAAAVAAAASVATLCGALAANRARREGWAFVGTALTIGLLVVTLFTALYPAVLPSTLPTGDLTVTNAASSPYTLRLMTWVAAIFAPLVLLYQGWTYWVFRKRVTTADNGYH
ncbi:cytochrome d ubiquinol oxidase subunit II [Phytohabitans sp. ZYX-F-186]|uniref:Cytochrome d ubiquinol oxidase subunit II n=1 Tax=Phytohabitans maris TaxID=3071409 RepID=A0ABU0ZGH1_9ACTN|nr:cytochrome d ubiquinol oxidase subunit II [Phytohabitans sp. ZYX-F-186]MDQ7906166.1 cytochrome d ubiquinol oxidase subunit II [Phytohabitans sp. ZYX-F-186]